MVNKKFLIVLGMVLLAVTLAYVSGNIFLNNSSSKINVPSTESGLVGYWPLNGDNYNSATNKTTDKTPYSNHGTNYGATLTIDRMGQSNGAMDFDGNDYIDLPNNIGYTNQFSVFTWFKSNGTPPGNYHIILGGSELEISIPTSGQLRTGVYTNIRYVSNHGSGLVDGEWHFVGFTFNGTNKSSYIDGEYVGSLDVAGTLTSNFANRRIGRFGSSSTYYLNGSIFGLRIYNRALSGEEITSLYNLYKPQTGSGSLQKGLVLEMPLDLSNYNSATGRVTDKTPYSNHGTNYGATFGSDNTTFNGNSTNYISVPDSVNFDLTQEGFTYSAWINPSSFPGTYNMFMGHYLPYFNVRSSRVLHMSMGAAGAQRSVLGTTTLNAGSWYHAVATYDEEGYMRVYLNGEQDGIAGPFLTPSNYNYNLYIGKWYSGITYLFYGSIQNIRVYNRALSAEEIKLLYDRGL